MQQYNHNCQLSQEEKRLLAEAELRSQRRRLHELRTEQDATVRRIRRAEMVLLEAGNENA